MNFQLGFWPLASFHIPAIFLPLVFWQEGFQSLIHESELFQQIHSLCINRLGSLPIHLFVWLKWLAYIWKCVAVGWARNKIKSLSFDEANNLLKKIRTSLRLNTLLKNCLGFALIYSINGNNIQPLLKAAISKDYEEHMAVWVFKGMGVAQL